MTRRHIPRRRGGGFDRRLYDPRLVLIPGTRRAVPHPLSIVATAARRARARRATR